ncbi:hypothetical protein [Streptomyces blattellae]|uniref:hypothetical protein n=1 Tax=Streptomyces blattellae TaxID=2569855 RepID=UPI0012B6F361|nr:hypothetical protein [Streptomyces blattellae]
MLTANRKLDGVYIPEQQPLRLLLDYAGAVLQWIRTQHLFAYFEPSPKAYLEVKEQQEEQTRDNGQHGEGGDGDPCKLQHERDRDEADAQDGSSRDVFDHGASGVPENLVDIRWRGG